MTVPASTVVIATRGNPELVVDAVRSVLDGATRPDQLVLVDQSRPLDARVAALAAEDPVELIHSETTGLSRAQNIAILAATGDAIVFTDDDVLVEADWLAQMLAALVRGGSRVAVTGRVLATDEHAAEGKAIALATDPEPAVYRGQLAKDVLSGNSMAFHRGAFDECGLFDEQFGPGAPFPSAGDNDFGYRLLRAGYEIHYVPQAVVYHRPRQSNRAVAKSMREMGRGQGAFLAKHALAGDRAMRRRLGSAVAWWLRRLATRPLRERSSHGHGDLRYLSAFLGGAAQYWVGARRARRSASIVGKDGANAAT